MTMVGIGIDLVDLTRLRSVSDLRRVAEYILTESELPFFEQSRDPVEYLGSRFAAKESVIKAFPGSLGYRDVAIEKIGVKPSVRFLNEAHRYESMLSLTHTQEYAASVCVLSV